MSATLPPNRPPTLGRPRVPASLVYVWAAVFVLASTGQAHAQIANGGFESGDLTGWTAGDGLAVEVIAAGGLAPAVAPSEGTFMALLSTGPGDRGGPTGDWDANGTDDEDGTTLSATFTIGAAPASLSFNWAFLTSEEDEADDFDDIFEARLNGVLILGRSVNKPGGISPYADTPAYDGTAYTATTGGTVDGSTFNNGSTGFQNFCLVIPTAGTYTLQFRIADQSDGLFDSGVLIDDVLAPSTCAPSGLTQVTDTSGSNLEVKGGGFNFTVQSNREVAMSDDGDVIAFTSDGNHDFSNPNLQTQIWALEGSTIERISDLASGIAKQPAVTSNGRWVVYSASGDSTGGNPDGNFEIYRYDRQLDATLQITDTTNCENSQPTVSHNNRGRRIAFLTDCSDIDGSFNADGNQEFVLWNDSGNFTHEETTGCINRLPRISQHNAGRYISFLSTCDYVGDNADGNQEVFQYNRNGTMEQITDTSGDDVQDAVSSSWDGRWVSFLSNADLTGENADGSLEVFLWDRNNTSFDQLTDAPATTVYLATSVDDDGDFVAFERLDALLFIGEVGTIDVGTEVATTVGSGVDVSLPSIGIQGGAPVIAFQSSGNFDGGNGDGNQEIWTSASGFAQADADAPCVRPNLAVPDDGSTSDDLAVVSTSVIADLDLYLDIAHDHVGDLTVTLEHVDSGTSAVLIDRPGVGGGGGFGCAGDDILVVLDDTGTGPVEDVCDAAVPTISGTQIPNAPLAAFAGESYDGTWRLTVDDGAAGDAGTLVEWCLFFEPVP